MAQDTLLSGYILMQINRVNGDYPSRVVHSVDTTVIEHGGHTDQDPEREEGGAGHAVGVQTD